MPSRPTPTQSFREPDWEFFLPDDEAYPDPSDFWIEPDGEDL
ncbi:MAG: hypothetical protein ACRCT8_08870 [Lacipirellulaceae bacterium]